MSTQNETEQKKLTLDDPVDPETLAKFSQLQGARLQVAERILDLEQEKVRALRAVANIDNERQKLFESILISRGLPPQFPVEIDAKTGIMKPVEGAAEAFMRQQAAQEVPAPAGAVSPTDPSNAPS